MGHQCAGLTDTGLQIRNCRFKLFVGVDLFGRIRGIYRDVRISKEIFYQSGHALGAGGYIFQ